MNEIHVDFQQDVHAHCHHLVCDLYAETDKIGIVFLKCGQHNRHDDLPARLERAAAEVDQHGHAAEDVLPDRNLIGGRLEVMLEDLLEGLQEFSLELVVG